MPFNNISDAQQGILTLLFGGAGNEIEINLTPDASNNINISGDLSIIISDLCAYIATQPCMRTYALVNIEHNASLFPSNSTILQDNKFVIVTCSDAHLKLSEIDGAFLLDISPVPSGSVTVSYANASPAFTSDATWPLSGNFHIDFAQQDWSVISPHLAGFPTITDTHIVDKALLCVDLDHAPVTEVGRIGCVPLCQTTTADPEYICHLLDCCSDVEMYLAEHYPDYMSKITDTCTIRYNGPVCGLNAVLNLPTCRLRIDGAAFYCSDRFIVL